MVQVQPLRTLQRSPSKACCLPVVASLIGNLSHPAVPRMTSLVIVDVSVGMDGESLNFFH